MLPPGDFLRDELENVERCLKEALRYEYGADRGTAFFLECNRRLGAIRGLLPAADTADALAGLYKQTSQLSALVSRIERSHQGEFSWSFAHEIRQLANAVCASPASSDTEPPQFFFSSNGGLDAYRVFAEQELSDPVRVPIFNIVFPRTLKHHVLLHPILGHEIGHAALVSAKTVLAAKAIFHTLFSGTPLASSDTPRFRQWLSDHQLVDQDKLDPVSDPDLGKIAEAWRIEFFCDLFGILLMGPSFIGAHLTVLASLDPEGRNAGAEHPPPLCRYWMLRSIAEHLTWFSYGGSSADELGISAYWWSISTVKEFEPWIGLVPQSNAVEATKQMLGEADAFGSCFYSMPRLDDLKDLVQQVRAKIPPVGSQRFLKKPRGVRPIDFRTVLFAGWVALQKPGDLSFLDINRLCDQGILQQQAIRTQLDYPKNGVAA